MDRKCMNNRTQIYKHFDPKAEKLIPADLPSLLPKRDEELKNTAPKRIVKPRICNKQQKPLLPQKKKINQKSSTDTQLTHAPNKLNVVSSSNKSTNSNKFKSKTDPCNLNITKTCPKNYKPKIYVKPPPSILEDYESRIAHNIENIQRQTSSRLSIQNPMNSNNIEHPPQTSKSTSCVLNAIDSYKSSNCFLATKYLQTLREEIKNFTCSSSPSVGPDCLANLREEISNFRKTQDEKYNLVCKKIQLLKPPEKVENVEDVIFKTQPIPLEKENTEPAPYVEKVTIKRIPGKYYVLICY